MKSLLTAIAVIMFGSVSWADTVNFYVNGHQDNDAVTFTSKAPLESIVGKTSEIRGYVEVDPANVSIGARAKFAVDLASLETGIGLRNKHMRENHLETDQFPEAVFVLSKVEAPDGGDLTDGQPEELLLEGEFSIHGITQTINITANVTYHTETDLTKKRMPGDLLHIKTRFEVLLEDYQIKRPEFLFLKLSEKQLVKIDIHASTGLPEVTFED